MIAQTILEQLGGNKFMVMTGARNLLNTGDGLSFRLPTRFAKDGINAVAIRLDVDTYTVKFSKVGRAPNFRIEVVSEMSDVYAEDLQRIFKSVTGLDTHL